jgi:threonine/homoserine/homoserine lactone efflux protein
MFTGFLIGALIGILIALPTGPVGLLCIQKTLVFGKRSGLLSVFGSLFADLFFSAVVVFSLTFIIRFFADFSTILQFAGGVLFLFIAWQAKRIVIVDTKAITIPTKTPMNDFLETFILTFTNPTFIFSLSFLFTLFQAINHTGTLNGKIIFLAGVACGSLLWWVTFIYLIDKIHRKKAGGIPLQKINNVSTVVFFIIGIFFIITAGIRLFV